MYYLPSVDSKNTFKLQVRFTLFSRQINLSISILDTIDITTGQVLTPAPGARVVTIEDSHIIWQVFAAMIWNINLVLVWEELKNRANKVDYIKYIKIC